MLSNNIKLKNMIEYDKLLIVFTDGKLDFTVGTLLQHYQKEYCFAADYLNLSIKNKSFHKLVKFIEVMDETK